MGVEVSIICPTKFNADTLENSLISALSQQCDFSFEVVVAINELDMLAPNIIRKLQQKYTNLKTVIVPDIIGIMGARLSAIEISSGKFICFLDADDKYCPNFLQKMHDAIISYNADIVQCNFYKEYIDKSVKGSSLYYKKVTIINNKEKLFKEFLIDWKIKGYLWNKIFNRSLFNNSDLIVKEQNIIYEDGRALLSYFLTANKVVCIPDHLYIYNVHNIRSETAKPRCDKVAQRINFYKNIVYYINNTSLLQIMWYLRSWLYLCLWLEAKNIYKFGYTKKEFKSDIKQFKYFLKNILKQRSNI